MNYLQPFRPSAIGLLRSATPITNNSFPVTSHRLHATIFRMSSTQKPTFSKGVDEQALQQKLQPLISNGRWTLAKDGEGLERTFKFKTFAKTWDFMTAVSLQCKLKNHHPEWSNVYNTTYIRWTTHEPKGLSTMDVELATICDELARDFGEVPTEPAATATLAESPNSGESCQIRGLADRAATGAGDCCVPKSKKN